MPNPRSLLSAYPPAYFDEILQKQGSKQINVYIDLKNAMTSMFVPQIVEEIALNTKNSGRMDSSIFQSVILYCCWWREYCNKKNIDCKIHISSDYGRSFYHNSIYKRYKENRLLSTTSMTPYDEEFREIRQKNTELLSNVCKKLPNVHFYLLSMLEADFVPYYLITRKFNTDDILHVVVSSDHDMYQVLKKPNIIQLFRIRGESRILTRESSLFHFFGVEKKSVNAKSSIMGKLENFQREYISALMAPVGDAGDSVPGVPRIGPKTALDLFLDKKILNELIGTPEELDQRVFSGGMYLKEYDKRKSYGPWDKILNSSVEVDKKADVKSFYDINELLTISYKLQSFEQLCLWLEKKDTTSKFDWIKHIDSSLDKQVDQMIPTPRAFVSAASKLEDNVITEAAVSHLYA